MLLEIVTEIWLVPTGLMVKTGAVCDWALNVAAKMRMPVAATAVRWIPFVVLFFMLV